METPWGKTLGYHQDAAYDDWIIPQTMVTCWMSLDNTSKSLGTLEFVKGSHLWELQPPKGEFHSPTDYKEQLNIFAEKIKEIDIVYKSHQHINPVPSKRNINNLGENILRTINQKISKNGSKKNG